MPTLVEGLMYIALGVALGIVVNYKMATVDIGALARATEQCGPAGGLSWMGLDGRFGCRNGLAGTLPKEP